MNFEYLPFLISIDGPDGSGKSTLAKILVEELLAMGMKATSVRPTYFETSARALQVRDSFERRAKELDPHGIDHNGFFLEAMSINYTDVVLPLIRNGQLVVLDSSEIRALAFVLDRGTPEAVANTISRISDGTLTHGCRPFTRIIVSGCADDLLLNLRTKTRLDHGDPQSVPEIEKRIAAYERTIETIRGMDGSSASRWMHVRVCHVDESSRDSYLRTVARNEIIKNALTHVL